MMMIDGIRGNDGMIFRLTIVGSIEPRAVLIVPTIEWAVSSLAILCFERTLYNIGATEAHYY